MKPRPPSSRRPVGEPAGGGPLRRRAKVGLVALLGVLPACASRPPDAPEPGRLTLHGFSVVVPHDPGWEVQSVERAISYVSAPTAARPNVFSLSLNVIERLPDPIHPYDLIAIARIKADGTRRTPGVELRDSAERLVRHAGMDCVAFEYSIKDNREPDPQVVYSMLWGAGMVCVHPDDRRQAAEAGYSIRNLGGPVGAAEREVGEAYLRSFRAEAIPPIAHD